MMTTAGLVFPPASADDGACHDLAGDPCETAHGVLDGTCRSVLARGTCDTADQVARDPCDALLAADTCAPLEDAGPMVEQAKMRTNCSIHPGTDLSDCSTTKHVVSGLSEPHEADILRVSAAGHVVYAKREASTFTIHEWQVDDALPPTQVSVEFEGALWSHLDEAGERLSLWGRTYVGTTPALRLGVFEVATGDLIWDRTWMGGSWYDPVVGSDGAYVVSFKHNGPAGDESHVIRLTADGVQTFDAPLFGRPRAATSDVVIVQEYSSRLYHFHPDTGAELAFYWVYTGGYGGIRSVEVSEAHDLVYIGIFEVRRACNWYCTYAYSVAVNAWTEAGTFVWSSGSIGDPDSTGGQLLVNETTVQVERQKRYDTARSTWYLYDALTGDSLGSRFVFNGAPFAAKGPSGDFTYTFPWQREAGGTATLLARVTNGAGEVVWESAYDFGTPRLLDHDLRHLTGTGGVLALQTIWFADGTYGLRSIHLPYLLWDSDQEVAPGVVVPNVG